MSQLPHIRCGATVVVKLVSSVSASGSGVTYEGSAAGGILDLHQGAVIDMVFKLEDIN